jgi:catechol 2,3-dioxygenase-like lactoylglutathione lyase family enzyme
MLRDEHSNDRGIVGVLTDTRRSSETTAAIGHVEIGVTDLKRSSEFYFDLLQVDPAQVLLVPVDDDGDDPRPIDRLEQGMAHVGWKVGDVPAQAERLMAAGVTFHIEPREATGGVRVAFFRDPNGAVLELIDRHLQYHRTLSDRLAEAERLAAAARPADAGPKLDHIAVNVDSLDASVSFYRELLGLELIGQVDLGGPSGITLTMVGDGGPALELFTYCNAELNERGRSDLGLRAIGVTGLRASSDEPVDPDGVRLRPA